MSTEPEMGVGKPSLPPRDRDQMETVAVEALWTPRQLAKRLSISVRQVQRLAAAGRIPAIYLGPRILRFSPGKIEKWLSGPAGCRRLRSRRTS